MIKDHLAVMQDLQGYASPKARLTRLLKSGSLIQVRRGLFVDNLAESGRALAAVIYGPSYLSFQYALMAHGLIPERVTVYTSATYGKNKDKHFSTPVGEFSYQYLPQAVYPYGIQRLEEQGLPYLMASPEKALCDSVYKMSSVTSRADLAKLILEDWRMELEDLRKLDMQFISWIAPLYRRRALLALNDFLSSEGRSDRT